jgi:hypothetical protein
MMVAVNTPKDRPQAKHFRGIFKGLCEIFGDAGNRLGECELLRLCNYAKENCPAVIFGDDTENRKDCRAILWDAVIEASEVKMDEEYFEWWINGFRASDPFEKPNMTDEQYDEWERNDNGDEEIDYNTRYGTMSFTRVFGHEKQLTMTYHPEGISERDNNWKWTFVLADATSLEDRMVSIALRLRDEGIPPEVFRMIYNMAI